MMTFLLPLSIAIIVVTLIIILAIILLPAREAAQSAALRDLVNQYRTANPADSSADASLATRIRTGTSTRTAKVLEKHGWGDRLRAGLTAAGMSLKPEEFVILTIGCGIGGMLGLFVLGRGTIPAALLGLFLGIATPVMTLRFKANRRESQFLYDLPDTLTALASSLSSGASMTQALDAVAAESNGPMAEELQRIIIENRLGTAVPDALEQTAVRMNCADLQMVVMAIRLQSSVGGNLSMLLRTVANTLRERVKMKRHVKALSAEGRMSLWVLMALPLVVAAFTAITRPDYFAVFYTTAPGIIMIVVGSIMMTLGYLWARSIVKVEV